MSFKEKQFIKKNESLEKFKKSKLFHNVLEKFPDANLVDLILKNKIDD